MADNDRIEKPSERKKDQNVLGQFRITEWASARVEAKRKRRGLGEVKPRKKNAMKQIFQNGLVLSLANTIVAPLERSRILLQTTPMSTYKHELPKTTREMLPKIIETQGTGALWRGMMPHIYKQWIQVAIKVSLYDKIKHKMMPYSRNKYSGLDLFFRSQIAAICCMAVTTAFTYPFDLYHTRISADWTPASRQRIYESTFQCFNRTNIEEGRLGSFRGLDFAFASAVIRAMLQLPVYDFVKSQSDKTLDPDSTIGSFTQRIGASMISGTLLACLLYPLDTFKRCAQLNGGIGYRLAFRSSSECTEYVFKESGGNFGLYRGCGTFFVSQVLLAFIQFSMFDAIRAASGMKPPVQAAQQATTD